MLFRMASPRRSKFGSITTRKGIPKDVRPEYKRLYGAGWEAKVTVPAGTRPQEITRPLPTTMSMPRPR
jgi:hypothetical protein